MYTGPVYSVDDLAERLCPWCIADGTAAGRYEATFTGGAVGDDVPIEVMPPDEVEQHLSALDKDGRRTAYLFRCRVCATHLAHSDFT
ncbi:CbrC family protein [Streptomyces olivochromogenes]|uniref:CbrC family protein n=1 Tax=Streptomyces olivochromogenes TaxID=1963 RepID=UPI0036B2E7B6